MSQVTTASTTADSGCEAMMSRRMRKITEPRAVSVDGPAEGRELTRSSVRPARTEGIPEVFVEQRKDTWLGGANGE